MIFQISIILIGKMNWIVFLNKQVFLMQEKRDNGIHHEMRCFRDMKFSAILI